MSAENPKAATPKKTAIVLKGYPRLSETFIAQEIRELERRGLPLEIVSLRHPASRDRHPIHDEIRAAVTYLPEYLWQEPLRLFRAWRTVRRLPAYSTCRSLWLRDLKRDPSPNRIRRFGQALVLAAELGADVRHLHAHFLHTPASVARYAAQIRGLGWSASAHAVDIYTTPNWELAEKIADAQWVATCTAANKRHLDELAAAPEKVVLAYHGLDLAPFGDPAAKTPPDGPATILSVGRLVEKKGYDDVLRALSRLPEGLDWRFRHIGGGPAAKSLARLGRSLGIAGKISWEGARPRTDAIAAYRQADIFVLASKIAANGDRDGLPNVLMEALAMELPCVTTTVSAIPELIRDGENGLLVPPGDPERLADALSRLLRDQPLRARFGRAGRETVTGNFEFSRCIRPILIRFELPEKPAVEMVA